MKAEQRTYRTVTSLSYDLVDSTALMRQIGAEEYAVLIEQIHSQFAEIVAQFGGLSDPPQGDDGLMCYFGALNSDQHAKESALLAALAMQSLARQHDWAIRMGLAYGQAAIYKGQPVGSTIHLAARIQKSAPSQVIFVSAALAAQTSRRFTYQLQEDTQAFRGFDLLPIVFELKQVKTTPPIELPRLEDKAKTYLYGRQGILRDLRMSWHAAQTAAHGACIQVVGEPGIGKSTLIQSFLHTTRVPKQSTFLWTCFQEQQQSAYQPLKNAFTLSCGLSNSEPQSLWLEKVDVKTSSLGMSAEQKSTIYYLLDLPQPPECAGVARLEDASAYEKRIQNAFIAWLGLESQGAPWLLIVEDLHWADPATLQFLARLRADKLQLRGLLITTERPRKAHTHAHVQCAASEYSIELSRLSYEDSSALVCGLSANLTLEAQEIDWIVERAGGVPLFIHECVRLIQTPNQINGERLSSKLRSTWLRRANSAHPIGLETQEILMQRIDALGEGRVLAQIASALGAEFRLEVLLLVARCNGLDDSKHRLLDLLDRLIEEGILEPSSLGTEYSHRFSHALIRDVAYQSMWESDRKKLHLIILEVYELHFPELMRSQPSQMARHWIAAGNYQTAAMCLLDAAQQARIKGAHLVSIDCCEAMLELLQSLPDTEAQQKNQLQATILAAGQIMATQGYAAEGAGLYFRRAAQLSHQLGDEKTLDKAQLGLAAYYMTRAEFSEAEHLISTGMRNPNGATDPLTDLQWNLAFAMLHFYRGDLQRCGELMRQCAEQSRATPKSHQLIQNPEVAGLMYRAYCLWSTGKTEMALDVARHGLRLADEQTLRLSKILAYGIWAMLLYCRGEWKAALVAAEVATGSSQAGEYELWLNLSQFITGAAKVRMAMQSELSQDHIAQGLSQMHQAEQSWASKSAIASRSFYLCTLAQCHLDLKQFDASRSCLDQAQALVNKHEERYFSTEVQRTQAALLMASRMPAHWSDLSRHTLNQAFDDAHARGLHSLALRTSLTMREWEELTQQEGAWSRHCQSASSLISHSLEEIEPFSSTADVVLARTLVHQNSLLNS